MAGLISTGQVGVREDLSDVIAVADAASTPFTSMIRKDKSLNNVLFQWQADDLEDEGPANQSVLDGTDVQTTVDATDGTDAPTISESYASADIGNKIENTARRRVLLSNYGSYIRRAFRVSPLSENVNNVAGLNSELAKGLAKTTTVVKRAMEKAFLGTQNKAVQDADSGYITRGMGSWCTSGDYAGETNTSYYQPNSGALKSVSDGTALTDSDVQDVLEGVYSETGANQNMTLVAGTALRRAFTDLVANVVTVAGGTSGTDAGIAATKIRTLNQEASSTTFNQSISVFQGDFGQLAVVPDLFTPNSETGYVIDPSRVAARYGILPRSKPLTDNGGGPGRLVETYVGLVVDNPKTIGRILINQ